MARPDQQDIGEKRKTNWWVIMTLHKEIVWQSCDRLNTPYLCHEKITHRQVAPPRAKGNFWLKALLWLTCSLGPTYHGIWFSDPELVLAKAHSSGRVIFLPSKQPNKIRPGWPHPNTWDKHNPCHQWQSRQHKCPAPHRVVIWIIRRQRYVLPPADLRRWRPWQSNFCDEFDILSRRA